MAAFSFFTKNKSSTMKSTLSSVIFLTSAVVVVATAIHVATSEDITFGILQNLIPSTPIPTSALQPCPPKSLNCIRTTWTCDTSKDISTMQQELQQTFLAYPQQGQNGIDKGGWSLIKQEDGSSLDIGKFRVEYQSGPGGFFSRLFNKGKPFIDDVLVELIVEDNNHNDPKSGKVEIRSSSRQGVSDLGVNAKRITYLANYLSTTYQGWTTPEPKYPS
jgi:hypothetical protein